uniref:Uncharacterized protein n=1 Tax=Candidatus Kentrum sp. SD TaxID=2126332 RepID=A0A451BSE3_9GAMM|nr:MAG: hypothetical protein BECKSD772D_GA0070982_12543 [Candidatus Kentron sp. SD]
MRRNTQPGLIKELKGLDGEGIMVVVGGVISAQNYDFPYQNGCFGHLRTGWVFRWWPGRWLRSWMGGMGREFSPQAKIYMRAPGGRARGEEHGKNYCQGNCGKRIHTR